MIVMTLFRTIPLPVHAAIETLAAPAVMAAPFLLGFSEPAAVAAFVFGAMLLGLAVQSIGPRRSIPIAAHAGFDYALAALVAIAGLVVGLATADWGQAIFLVGIGVAQVALTASTRFSVPFGA